MTLRPSSPLEFASPLGNSGVVEFRRMRVDSSADAQRNTIRPRNSKAWRVWASITRTPDTFRVLGSNMRLCTTLCGRRVSFPVSRAAGSEELRLLKYERVLHPRWHGPQ